MLPHDKETQLLQALEARSHQRSFYVACSTIPVHGKKKFMLLVTTGGGKQADAYLAEMGIVPSIADAFCWVTPRTNLRDQGERIPGFLANVCDTLGWTRPEYRAADNKTDPRRGAKGYVTTIQSIAADPGLHVSEFRRARYCLILDEIQFLMEEGKWQQTLQPLVDMAAVLVVMSGTPYRGDHQPVALLPYTTNVDGQEVLDKTHPDWITIEYSRADGIRQGAILPLEFLRHDTQAQYMDGKNRPRKFQAFGEGVQVQRDLRDQIRIAVKGDAARAIIRDTMDRWAAARRDHPDCQCIVVVESQRSARDHAKWITKHYSGHAIGLAISEEAAAHDTIKEFCAGHLDILVTCSMAYVGMDAVRASHMALCCVIRSRPYIEQAVGRLVRPHERQQRGIVVTFNDPLMLEVTKRIEEEQNEAVWRPQPTGAPGGGVSTGVDEPLHIWSELTEMHAHELNRVQLSPEMTRHYSDAAAKFGISLTPGQTHDFINTALGVDGEPMQGGRAAPIIGRAELEKKYSSAIEIKARAFDSQRGWEFGTTNKRMYPHFRKSRDLMTVEELARALAWLNSFIAANGGQSSP